MSKSQTLIRRGMSTSTRTNHTASTFSTSNLHHLHNFHSFFHTSFSPAMASLAASTASASLCVSEMLRNPLSFSGASTRAAPSTSSPPPSKPLCFSGRSPLHHPSQSPPPSLQSTTSSPSGMVHVNLQQITQRNRNYFIRHRNWAGQFVGPNKNPYTRAAMISATSSASVCIVPALEVQEIRERSNKWQWNQYSINYFFSHYQSSQQQPQSSSSSPVVLLVHGFGASIPHWRRNIPTLSQYSTVYAIDLLGFGASDKPSSFAYTMETWANLILDFVDQVIKKPTVLVGNSVGSLACVIAASDSSRNLVRGLVLLNCAGGMNNKAIVDDWRIKLLLPLLWLFNFLLNQRIIASALFERVKKRETLRNILSSVYGNKESVDEDLIDIIVEPTNDEGALDAFVSIVTGPPGPSPVQLMPKISVPVLILWGDEDPFTPLDGPVGKYFRKLSVEVPNVSLFVLKGVGHCPHDDRPELVHEKLLPWLAQLPAL